VDRKVKETGGQPLMERAGHSFIYSRMLKEKAVLGGEASGHFFIPGLFPGDALYTFLKLLEILKESGQTLGKLFDAYPPCVSTHDVKMECKPEILPELYKALEARAREMGGEVSTIDGVRAVFPEGWGILRASVTEPVLSCRFESSDKKKLTKMVEAWLKDQPALLELVLHRIQEDL